MKVIEFRNVSKSFGGLKAVSDLSFGVSSGSIKGIIGPNGAGKTTIFNLISGILPLSHGEISYKGSAIHRMKTFQIASLGISRTFQNLQLFDNMSVIENVMVGFHSRTLCGILGASLRLKKSRSEEAVLFERAYEALKLVNMESRASEMVSEMPYGDQKLVEIARALVSNPDLILLDEPVSGLNAQEIDRLADLIGRIKGQGKTILLVEHNMKFVMGICDEILVLSYGERIAEGNPSQIVKNREVITAYLGEDWNLA
jgi:ABC-type branched-subunit amino acid transport system ATPase component